MEADPSDAAAHQNRKRARLDTRDRCDSGETHAVDVVTDDVGETSGRRRRRRRRRKEGEREAQCVDLDVANSADGPVLWTLRDLSTSGLLSASDYFAALLDGPFRESSCEGPVRVVLPIDDSTPFTVLDAALKHMAGVEVREIDPVSLACSMAYMSDTLAFLCPTDDYAREYTVAILDVLAHAFAHGSTCAPSLVVLFYLMHASGVTCQGHSIDPSCHPLPLDASDVSSRSSTSSCIPWIAFGGALFDTLERLLAQSTSLLPSPSSPSSPSLPLSSSSGPVHPQTTADAALLYFANRVQDSGRAVRHIVSVLLRDWRESLVLHSSAGGGDDVKNENDPAKGSPRSPRACLPPTTIDPFVRRSFCDEEVHADQQPERHVWRRHLAPTLDAFRKHLCLDFPVVGPLLLTRDDSPLFPHNDNGNADAPRPDDGVLQGTTDGRVIVAGGSVVNAVQAPELRRHLEGSDIDLWIVGSDADARRAAFCRTVAWMFSVVENCTAEVRGPIVTLAVPAAAADGGTTAESRVEKVQIIMTDCATADDVVATFDMTHVCAWYDGRTVGMTPDCLRSVITRTTRHVAGDRPVMLTRFDKARDKGFVPLWKRSDSPSPVYGWIYDESWNDGRRRQNVSDAAPVHRDAHAVCTAFGYAPLVRPSLPPSFEKHLVSTPFVPRATRYYGCHGLLTKAGFDDDGEWVGCCLVDPISIYMPALTIVGTPTCAPLPAPSPQPRRGSPPPRPPDEAKPTAAAAAAVAASTTITTESDPHTPPVRHSFCASIDLEPKSAAARRRNREFERIVCEAHDALVATESQHRCAQWGVEFRCEPRVPNASRKRRESKEHSGWIDTLHYRSLDSAPSDSHDGPDPSTVTDAVMHIETDIGCHFFDALTGRTVSSDILQEGAHVSGWLKVVASYLTPKGLRSLVRARDLFVYPPDAPPSPPP